MSEMECQFTQKDLEDLLMKLQKLLKAGGFRTFDEVLMQVPDEKDRIKLKVAYAVADKIVENHARITDVEKVICWRDENGKPGRIQIEMRRDRP